LTLLWLGRLWRTSLILHLIGLIHSRSTSRRLLLISHWLLSWHTWSLILITSLLLLWHLSSSSSHVLSLIVHLLQLLLRSDLFNLECRLRLWEWTMQFRMSKENSFFEAIRRRSPRNIPFCFWKALSVCSKVAMVWVKETKNQMQNQRDERSKNR
jgi:hypothetical protein